MVSAIRWKGLTALFILCHLIIKRKRSCFVLLFLSFLIGCSGSDKGRRGELQGGAIHVSRLDKDLYQLVLSDSRSQEEALEKNYLHLLTLLEKTLFQKERSETALSFDRLINYFSEPTLNRLYRETIARYDRVDTIEEELTDGFRFLSDQLSSMQRPAFYMHVSGLQQNVLVDDSLLSLSIDKYMGADYPLYQDYFYDYQLRKMNRENIVPDYLAAWLMSEFPFEGEHRLLDRMIYEGKIKYLLREALPKVLPKVLMGYSPQEEQWCKEHESAVWKRLIEQKELFATDRSTIVKYFAEQPARFIDEEAPGNLGCWFGWQIVNRYMKRKKVSLEALMAEQDYQAIFTQSKYKP